MIDFGIHLRACREHAGVARKALARALGVSSQFLIQVENGDRPMPSKYFAAIAREVPGWEWPTPVAGLTYTMSLDSGPVSLTRGVQRQPRIVGVTKVTEAPRDEYRQVHPPPPPAPDELPAPSEDVKAITVEVLRVLRARLANCPVSEKRHVANAIAQQAKVLASVTGQTEVTWPQIVRSRAWREVLDVVGKTLAPYPHALRALGEALIEYGNR